jgi:hypothetical protein
MKLDVAGLALSFALSIVVFPVVYPWYAAAGFLVAVLGSEMLLLNAYPYSRLAGALARAVGIATAGGWVYLLRECSASFLGTYCHR